MDAEPRPLLRPVEPIAVEVNGRSLIALRDPDGYCPETALVEPGAVGLLALFDGSRTLREIQELLLRGGDGILPIEALEEMVDALDRCLLLDNGRFAAERYARESAFAAAPVREAAHAGAAYPEDSEGARGFLDGLLALAPEAPPRRLARLVAPHIDLRLGGEIYGHAHRALRASGRPDVAVVLGVCHAPTAHRFVACRKDFATPFGTVRHDPVFLDSLEGRLGASLLEGQVVHRNEHSVEFQALWLAHLWPGDPPAIVPLLVGSFHDFVAAGASPSEDRGVEAFVRA
ncbi:MAG: AmmeMemoRadiSam system protein B, partial [Planctomycetota bacterium]